MTSAQRRTIIKDLFPNGYGYIDIDAVEPEAPEFVRWQKAHLIKYEDRGVPGAVYDTRFWGPYGALIKMWKQWWDPTDDETLEDYSHYVKLRKLA